MKIKDITECSGRWSTPLGTMTPMRLWRTACLWVLLYGLHPIIGLAVQCQDGKYFSSIRVQRDIYDRVLPFLRQSHGRKLREVPDAEIDISDVIQ
jgi:hypothetical protein